MCEGDTASFLRQSICDKSIKGCFCIWARDFDLCKGSDIHDTNRVTYSCNFSCNLVMYSIAAERILVLLRHVACCKPTRAFMSIDLFIDSTFFEQPLIKRPWFYRATRQPVEMREWNFMAKTIILFRLCHLPVWFGVATKASWVKFPHRYISSAMNHPFRKFPRQARSPANADLCATATPVILNTRCRANKRVAIRWMRNGAMHFTFNAKLSKYRHSVQGIFEPWHDAVIICFKKLVFSFPRAMVFPNCVRIFFLINPDKAGFLLHSDIARDKLVITNDRQFFVQVFEFWHCICDKIMMCHAGHWQL